jgi:hypothetical protein
VNDCNKIVKDMASNVIKALYQGELSDPPGISWNTQLLVTDERVKIDKDGWSVFVVLLSWNCVQERRFTKSIFLLQ